MGYVTTAIKAINAGMYGNMTGRQTGKQRVAKPASQKVNSIMVGAFKASKKSARTTIGDSFNGIPSYMISLATAEKIASK